VNTVYDSAGADNENTLYFAEAVLSELKPTLDGRNLCNYGGDKWRRHRFPNVNPDDLLGTAPFGRIEFADGTTITYAEFLAQGFDIAGTPNDDPERNQRQRPDCRSCRQ
jgi:hypothetical protein